MAKIKIKVTSENVKIILGQAKRSLEIAGRTMDAYSMVCDVNDAATHEQQLSAIRRYVDLEFLV